MLKLHERAQNYVYYFICISPLFMYFNVLNTGMFWLPTWARWTHRKIKLILNSIYCKWRFSGAALHHIISNKYCYFIQQNFRFQWSFQNMCCWILGETSIKHDDGISMEEDKLTTCSVLNPTRRLTPTSYLGLLSAVEWYTFEVPVSIKYPAVGFNFEMDSSKPLCSFIFPRSKKSDFSSIQTDIWEQEAYTCPVSSPWGTVPHLSPSPITEPYSCKWLVRWDKDICRASNVIRISQLTCFHKPLSKHWQHEAHVLLS